MPPLTALLDSADDALKGSALRVVVHLAAKAASAKAVAMLRGTNDALTNNALDVLLVLADANKLADAGAIKSLVALLRRDTDDAQKEKAARVLGSLAFEEAYEMPIAKAGAIPPLVQLLSSTDDALKGSAALDEKNLRDMFQSQDKDGSGFVTYDELVTLCAGAAGAAGEARRAARGNGSKGPGAAGARRSLDARAGALPQPDRQLAV